LVSKHRDRAYQGGRQKHWIKMKNRQHHTFERVRQSFARTTELRASPSLPAAAVPAPARKG
jgi:ATP-dependent DNA ligase